MSDFSLITQDNVDVIGVQADHKSQRIAKIKIIRVVMVVYYISCVIIMPATVITMFVANMVFMMTVAPALLMH